MSKLRLFSLATLITLFVLPSCKKAGDIIRNPDANDLPCQITSINIDGYYGNADQYIIGYNAKGNPDSMVDVHPVDNLGNPRYFFRYDKRDRLSDFMITNQASSTTGAYYAFAWHKYAYPQPNYVTDTLLNYAGDVRGPEPLAASAVYFAIHAYTLDAHGRIIKIWSIQEPNGTPHAPVLQSTIAYDANGNRPLTDSGLAYDNKVNFYRTNKVWQFIFNDYSRNNLIKKNSPFVPVYNSVWLPTHLENLNPNGGGPFNIWNTNTALNITYACSLDY